MFHQLVSAYVNVEGAERTSVARFVELTAEAELRQHESAHEVLQSDAWNDHAGAVYSAIVNPAFALGFALAYRLRNEE